MSPCMGDEATWSDVREAEERAERAEAALAAEKERTTALEAKCTLMAVSWRKAEEELATVRAALEGLARQFQQHPDGSWSVRGDPKADIDAAVRALNPKTEGGGT